PPAYHCIPLQALAVRPLGPQRDVTGTLATARKLRRGKGPLYADWYSAGGNELAPVLADARQASPGVVPIAQFFDESGTACQIMPGGEGKEYCVFVQQEGEVTSFPQVSY